MLTRDAGWQRRCRAPVVDPRLPQASDDGGRGSRSQAAATRHSVRAHSRSDGGEDCRFVAFSPWRSVMGLMFSVRSEYDEALKHLNAVVDAIFEQASMKNVGPYRLTAFLMWSGLNGRSNVWSIVRDDAGKWWRIKDLEKEEVRACVSLASRLY